jgi:hypothetical protein
MWATQFLLSVKLGCPDKPGNDEQWERTGPVAPARRIR